MNVPLTTRSIKALTPVLWLLTSLVSCGSPLIVRNLGYTPQPTGPLPPEDGTAFGLAPAAPELACEIVRSPQTEQPQTTAVTIVNPNYLVSINTPKSEISVETFDQKSRSFVVERVHDLQQRGAIQLFALAETLPQSERPGVLSFERRQGKSVVTLLQLDAQGYKRVNTHELGNTNITGILSIYQDNKENVILSGAGSDGGTTFWQLSTLPSSSALTPSFIAKHSSGGSFKIIGPIQDADHLLVSEGPVGSGNDTSKIWMIGKGMDAAILLWEGPLLDAMIKEGPTAQEQTLVMSVAQSASQSFHPIFSQFAVGGVWSLGLAYLWQTLGQPSAGPLPSSSFQTSAAWRRISAIPAQSILLRGDSILGWLQEPSYSLAPDLSQDVLEAHRFFQLSGTLGKQKELQPACYGPALEKVHLLKDIGYLSNSSTGAVVLLAKP